MKKNVFHTLLASLMLVGVGGNANGADFTIAAGEDVSYSSLTDFNQTSNITGPGADEEKGVFRMDISDDQFSGVRYKGKITGNLDLYYTGTGNWRMYGVNDYTGDTYVQSRASVYLTTGKELGTGTIYWQGNGGHIVNEGNEGFRATVLDNNVVLATGKHVFRCGWNIDNNPASFTLNGVISGEGALSFNEGEFTPGTFVINGANTYSGGTLLRGSYNGNAINPYATYVLGNSSAFGTGTVTAEGCCVIDVSNISEFSNNIIAKEFQNFKQNVVKNTGSGAVTLKSNTIDVQSGTLEIQNTGSGSISLVNSNSSITVKGTLGLKNTGAGSITLGNSSSPIKISGTIGLQNTGTGFVSVGASNSYVSIQGNGTLAFNSSGTAYLTDLSSISITGPSTEGEKAAIHYNSTTWGGSCNNKFSGNLDLFIEQATRFFNAESDFTATITTNQNIYLKTGRELGFKKENTIIFNGGQLVNQGVNEQASVSVIPNDIVLNNTITMRAGWNSTKYEGGDKSSITLTGDISGVGGINFNNETNAGAIYLRGNNTFSGNVYIAYGYNAAESANHRAWFGIGSDSAFGTGVITVNTYVPTTVFDFETATGAKTLNNDIVVSQNTLQFRNSGGNDAVITGDISGNTALPIQIGSATASENNGKIFFNGSTEKAMTVNSGATLGGTGSIGSLTINDDASLYLSSAMNYGSPLTMSSLTLDGDLAFELDETAGLDKILLDSKSTILGDDFAITIAYDGDASQISVDEITVASFGSGVELENLAASLSLSGGLDSWTPLMSNGVLTLASASAVPEPGTWTLILLALPTVYFFRRSRKQA